MKRRWLSISVAVLMVMSFVACGGATTESSSSSVVSSSESESVTSSSEQSISQSEDSVTIPIVKGSNAYDITVSLEKNGLPKAERSETDDGFTFSATNSEYSYIIETDKDYALSYADYYVLGEDKGFLGFCASFPYDSADSQTIMTWVNENIGTEAETVIGDAEFYLSVAETGPVLKIQAAGRKEYLENKLFGEN